MIGSQYQAEIPPYSGKTGDDEKGKLYCFTLIIYRVFSLSLN